MTMKKLLFTGALLITLGGAAIAQTEGAKAHKTPEERAQHATDVLAKKLSLTDDQKSKVYAINLESFNKWKDAKAAGDHQDKSARKASMEERDQKINGVLNDAQRKSYQELKEKRAEKMEEHHKKKQGADGVKG
jgi:hypothetical protein